jgi:hypothetical protein
MAQVRPNLSSDPGPRFENCKESAARLLRKAADEWAKGNPQDPAPEKILTSILKIFADERFLRQPW